METIGVKDIIPKWIGTVIWYCTGDEGQLKTKKLNNLPYFTDSPVNILSATALSGPMKYDEGTCVVTKMKRSIFTWYFISTKIQ